MCIAADFGSKGVRVLSIAMLLCWKLVNERLDQRTRSGDLRVWRSLR